MRILVTGNAGSGKTTTARRIADLLDIPYHGLDRLVWMEGWVKRPAEEKARMIGELVSGGSWVIDGVSTDVQAAADVVVFLDVPRLVCLLRTSKRNWRYAFRSRPGLPDDCPEIKIVWRLWKIIWNFDSRMRAGIIEQGAGETGRFFHVRTAADLEMCVEEIRVKCVEVLQSCGPRSISTHPYCHASPTPL